jgi:hypothetical protein
MDLNYILFQTQHFLVEGLETHALRRGASGYAYLAYPCPNLRRDCIGEGLLLSARVRYAPLLQRTGSDPEHVGPSILVAQNRRDDAIICASIPSDPRFLILRSYVEIRSNPLGPN